MPETALERQLAQSIAEDNWRLNRIRAAEDNIFALGFSTSASDFEAGHPEVHAALTHARVFLSNPHQFHLITLYAQRTNRDIERNMKQLRELQAERKARYEHELAEAAKLRKLAELKSQVLDPAELTRPNGFAFSTTEIDRFIARETHLKQAKIADYYDWNREKYLKAGGTLAA